MVGYFLYFFYAPSTWGVGLAIAFGAVWLAGYRPPLFKKPWLWAVLVSSAFLTCAAICLIQNPLVNSIYQQHILSWLWSHEVLARSIFLVGIPLLGGLIQEGAKLVPVVVYWQRSGRNLDPKLGLVIGAVAGAGFAILEAHRALNYIFVSGLSGMVSLWMEFSVVNGFWGIFFTVAAQTAFSALAGYGLAKGRGWQFYLIASALHGLLGMALGIFPGCTAWIYGNPTYSLGASIYTAVLAALVTAWALWLRWRKTAATADPAISAP
jgi:RsiW-degrading membrane proteinase PrsW (M82 family)